MARRFGLSVSTQEIPCEILSCELVKHLIRIKLPSYSSPSTTFRAAWISFSFHFQKRSRPCPELRVFNYQATEPLINTSGSTEVRLYLRAGSSSLNNRWRLGPHLTELLQLLVTCD